LGFVILALLVSLIAAALIARSLVAPLRRLTQAAERLSLGDIAVDDVLPPACGSETGRLSGSFRAMVAHQQAMAAVAETIAAGDLTASFEPASARDVLGHTFLAMSRNLCDQLRQVATAASQVAVDARQLAETTDQVDAASSQISKAIEDVARDTSEQSKGAAKMIQDMSLLGESVTQVTAGASRQDATTAPAVAALHGMMTAIGAANASLQVADSTAARAVAAAQEGGIVVEQTLLSIASVQTTVQQSAERVGELGRRSAEIGHIVEAIDDIAAQTNLLALNAAIEAA
jgi:methyl-accepting chemotaxis protein